MRRRTLAAVFVSFAVPTIPGPLPAQESELSEYQRGLAIRMLRRVRTEIEEHYFDPGYNGKNLDQMDYRAQRTIESAGDLAEAFGGVAQFVADLGDSHTRFFPPSLTVEANYGWSWQMVGDDCYVVGVADGSDAKRKGLKPGDKVLAIDGLKPTRQNMRVIWYVYHALRPRQGMALWVERPDGTRGEVLFEAKLRRLPPEFDVTSLEHFRMFQAFRPGGDIRYEWKTIDSVALWRFSNFGYQDERLDRYMNDARGYPWLILDLRGNSGGAVEGITRLLGHFFPDSVPAFTQVSRDTTSEFVVRPRGDGPYTGQVIVLMNSSSASASEITARLLQMKGRAMVVGDRSAGAVVVSRTFGLAEQASDLRVTYAMSISVTDAIMPDSTRLEGTGVIPNVPALPTGRDIAEGRDPAMQFALEMAGIRMTPEEAGRVWR